MVKSLTLLLCGLLLWRTPAALCQKTPAVQKVENAGLLFTDNEAGVSGMDAGYSLPLAGQTLWLFGDVFLLDPQSPTKTYVGGVTNGGLLVSRGAGPTPLRHATFLTDPKTGLARHLLPPTAEEGTKIRLWPFGAWYAAKEKRVYLFYARIQTTGGGPLDFRTEGMGLARADASLPDKLEFARLPAAPDQPLWWLAAGDAPLFGSVVVANSPGDYLYIAGEQTRDGQKRGKMARVLKEHIADLKAYEYFAGGGPNPRWSSQIKEATDVEGLNDFPSELSIAYNAYLGGYLAVHSVGLSEKIRLSLAPNPWGPYTQIAEIKAPHRAFTQAFCYAGKEHPELAEERGRILYITYVDSSRYWLQLLKVTLSLASGAERR